METTAGRIPVKSPTGWDALVSGQMTGKENASGITETSTKFRRNSRIKMEIEKSSTTGNDSNTSPSAARKGETAANSPTVIVAGIQLEGEWPSKPSSQTENFSRLLSRILERHTSKKEKQSA